MHILAITEETLNQSLNKDQAAQIDAAARQLKLVMIVAHQALNAMVNQFFEGNIAHRGRFGAKELRKIHIRTVGVIIDLEEGCLTDWTLDKDQPNHKNKSEPIILEVFLTHPAQVPNREWDDHLRICLIFERLGEEWRPKEISLSHTIMGTINLTCSYDDQGNPLLVSSRRALPEQELCVR